MNIKLTEKYERLLQILTSQKHCLIAYSGGVDSTFLLFATREALGKNACGVLIDSPFLSKREKQSALSTAHFFNLPLIIEVVDPFQHHSIIENGPERCYFCKKFLFETIRALTEPKGFPVIADGSNVDDLSLFRPGRKALQELGIISPLVSAGFTKEEIRQVSRERNLPTWNQPSFSCLATRIPHGIPISIERLDRIEKAESILFQMGFQQLRVRDHFPIARVEIPIQDLTRVLVNGYRHQVIEGLKSCGYRWVTLDLEGYHSGNMNEDQESG